jgi:hypothetical protein
MNTKPRSVASKSLAGVMLLILVISMGASLAKRRPPLTSPALAAPAPTPIVPIVVQASGGLDGTPSPLTTTRIAPVSHEIPFEMPQASPTMVLPTSLDTQGQ